MFNYAFACWLAVLKHVINGCGMALLNISGFMDHYLAQVTTRIAKKAKAEFGPATIVHEYAPREDGEIQVTEDHEDMN